MSSRFETNELSFERAAAMASVAHLLNCDSGNVGELEAVFKPAAGTDEGP